MRTAEHLPSGWPFESSHYHSTFRTPQLAYCRHNVQPYSVHRKNNPHAAILDPWKYPDKVTFPHICGRGGMGGWQPCSQGLSSSRTFSLEEWQGEREREPRGEFGPLGLRDINIFFVDVFNRVTWCGGTIHLWISRLFGNRSRHRTFSNITRAVGCQQHTIPPSTQDLWVRTL